MAYLIKELKSWGGVSELGIALRAYRHSHPGTPTKRRDGKTQHYDVMSQRELAALIGINLHHLQEAELGVRPIQPHAEQKFREFLQRVQDTTHVSG